MTNNTLFKSMIDRYNSVAYTHNYIFGFTDRGNVYACFCNSSVLPYILKLDRASRGNGMSLRFKPTKAQKEVLKVNAKCEVLCSTKYFEELCTASKYNKGEMFEKLMTEYFGQKWTKDSVPFTKGGDLTANGIAYQIKFQSATFCNENSLKHLA